AAPVGRRGDGGGCSARAARGAGPRPPGRPETPRARAHAPGRESGGGRMGAGPGDERRSRVTPKFIFVTGGVVSSLGKGLAAASIGSLVQGPGVLVGAVYTETY